MASSKLLLFELLLFNPAQWHRLPGQKRHGPANILSQAAQNQRAEERKNRPAKENRGVELGEPGSERAEPPARQGHREVQQRGEPPARAAGRASPRDDTSQDTPQSVPGGREKHSQGAQKSRSRAEEN